MPVGTGCLPDDVEIVPWAGALNADEISLMATRTTTSPIIRIELVSIRRLLTDALLHEYRSRCKPRPEYLIRQVLLEQPGLFAADSLG